MRTSKLIAAIAALGLATAAFAASDIDGDHLLVKPAKNDKFATAEFIMGKVELFGYVGDLKDTKKITGIVLRDPDRATPEQKHLIAVIAQGQHIDAFVEDHGKLEPLADPTAPPAPAAAPSAAGN